MKKNRKVEESSTEVLPSFGGMNNPFSNSSRVQMECVYDRGRMVKSVTDVVGVSN